MMDGPHYARAEQKPRRPKPYPISFFSPQKIRSSSREGEPKAAEWHSGARQRAAAVRWLRLQFVNVKHIIVLAGRMADAHVGSLSTRRCRCGQPWQH
jgi:hypothetical protein